MPLSALTVVVGPNGSGKTNLYRALKLIAAGANGRLLEAIAREGGMPSIAWAGPRPTARTAKLDKVFRMTFMLEFEDVFYRAALGYPAPDITSFFNRDPEVKEELVWPRRGGERAFLFRRAGATLQAADAEGTRVTHPLSVETWELGLHALRDPERFVVLETVRSWIEGWRFYPAFRTDAEAPSRRPQVGFRSPILAEDGWNLAPTLRTIREIGDERTLVETIREAFDGASLEVTSDDRHFSFQLLMPGLHRPLAPEELSDGQLRFICLAAALLSPRPPRLFVLDEPESSLNEALFPLLARLLHEAARTSQVWLTTHSVRLAAELQALGPVSVVRVGKSGGATTVAGPPGQQSDDDDET